jgi:hypothetical protein
MEGEYKRHSFWRITGSIIGGVIIAAAFAVAFGALVMVLWNWLMPAIFGLGTIGYWQGFGLVLLVKLLFGGIGHKGMEPAKSKDYDGHWHGKEWHRKHDAKEWSRNHRGMHWHGYGHQVGHDGHFDDVYEDWWEKEGAASFEAFMGKKEPDKSKRAEAEEKKDE